MIPTFIPFNMLSNQNDENKKLKIEIASIEELQKEDDEGPSIFFTFNSSEVKFKEEKLAINNTNGK